MSKVDKAYKNYEKNCKKWGFERKLYTVLSKEEFIDKLLTDDGYNEQWSMGCTRKLSDSERFEILKERVGPTWPLSLNHDRIDQQIEKETPKYELR